MLRNSAQSLNFDLGETADMLREGVADFASAEIAPRAAEIDRSNEFPPELWRRSDCLVPRKNKILMNLLRPPCV